MYFITSVSTDSDYRCVGYVSSREKALDIVMNNRGDLYEAGCYPYVVIEYIPEGIYQYDQKPIWLEYDERIDKYVIMHEQPSCIAKHLVGFAIG